MSSPTAAEEAEPDLFTRDFALILLTQLAFGFAFSSFFLLPKFVVTALAGSPREVGFVGATSVVAAVLVSPLCGKRLDQGRRAPLMAWGCLLSGWAAFGFVHVSHVGAYLFALRALQGVGYTLYFVAAATLVSDLCPPARLGQALGWFGSAGLLMNAIATLLAERIADSYGWHAVFRAAALSGLLGALLSLALREPKHRLAHSEDRPLTPPPHQPRVLWAAAAGGAAFGAMFTFTQPLALSLGETNISPLFAGYTAAALFVRLFFGNAADRFGRARVGSAALAVYSLVVLATAGLARGWLVVVGLGFGLAHGAFYPSLNALALQGVARSQRGSVGAYFNAAFNAGTFVVTFCFGQVAQLYGYRPVFLLVACLSASGAFALLSRGHRPGFARS
ncbi:MAG TPA: MFS transporter [Polyangiaceae bacterium]|nr:MFS transporter [Polyangiaceae bacterium]